MRPQPSKIRANREAVLKRRADEAAAREQQMREHPDSESPESLESRLSKIGQAAGRVVKDIFWRKRKPIIKGGAVTGYQKTSGLT